MEWHLRGEELKDKSKWSAAEKVKTDFFFFHHAGGAKLWKRVLRCSKLD